MIKWSLEKSLKQKGDFQSVCVALIRLLVSIGLMMSDVWGYQPESKVRLSPAKIFPEIKQPDLMQLTVWGQSLMISPCLLQESERTQCWKLGLFFLHLLLQSEALFVLEWIWEETRWGHFLSHLEGFQFQSRSVCNLLWWLIFVWASPGNQPLSPHFVVRSLSKNLSFSWCLFNVTLHRVFLRLGRRWIQMAAKACEKEVPFVASLRNDILAHFLKNWTSPTRELVIIF